MTTAAPPSVEQRTEAWLDQTMDPGIAAPGGRLFDAAGRPSGISRYHFGRLRRKLRIFRWLDRLPPFASFIDLASGWDHFPWLVRQRYGAEAYYSDLVHRMNLPIDGPPFGKLDHAVTLRLPRLPFPDRAFDVVLCSEVLEHLVRPVESIAELLRVTNQVLLVTSLEAFSVNRWERFWQHHRVDVRRPHVDRNFLLRDELRALFGAGARLENLLHDPDQPASAFAPMGEQTAAYARLAEAPALGAALRRATAETRHLPGAMGVLAVVRRDGAPLPDSPAAADDALPEWLLERTREEECIVEETLAIAAAWQQGLAEVPQAAADALVHRPVAEPLRRRLCCPDCRGALAADALALRCPACATRFASQYGVPILYPTSDDRGAAGLAEALAQLCGDDPARRRALARLARRLRRNEAPPAAWRRAAWWLEDRLGLAGESAST
ncbi:methyltransferase domain-containing protein [bacterium]|nr:methyltransferase domain-containing protein [bacterium]